MIVAIASDDLPWPKGAHPDASAPRWAAELKAAGHEVRWVDVYRPDILQQLEGCDGFMWRHAHVADMRQIAQRLLPVVERELELVVYPDQRTCWHYDDKISQSYLFETHQIPAPKTWVWFDRDQALEWCDRDAQYPLVTKLWAGAGSVNVKLLRSVNDARRQVRLLFDQGTFASPGEHPWSLRRSLSGLYRGLTTRFRIGRIVDLPDTYWDVHHNYVYFQQWLPGNEFDTRVTVIGNRAFAFRRFNRPDDFRASGSAKLDWDADQIDIAFVRLAFKIARSLGTQSCAVDGLYSDGRPVVCEISYTYASSAVHQCPGHWELDGSDPELDQLKWCEGAMRPESAQTQDFVTSLESRSA